LPNYGIGVACNKHGSDKTCLQNFGREAEGIRPRGRYKRKRKNNITMYFTEIEWEIVDWMHLV